MALITGRWVETKGKDCESTRCQCSTFILTAAIESRCCLMAGSGYQWRAVSIIVARNAKRGSSSTTVALTFAPSTSCTSDSIAYIAPYTVAARIVMRGAAMVSEYDSSVESVLMASACSTYTSAPTIMPPVASAVRRAEPDALVRSAMREARAACSDGESSDDERSQSSERLSLSDEPLE